MDPSQMMYAVLRWTTDDNKLSIEHMRVIVDPKISYNDYLPGDQCTAKFGPSSKLYPVTIVAVGHSKKSLDESFRKALEERNKKDVDPTSITVSKAVQRKRRSTGNKAPQLNSRQKKKKSISDIATDMAVSAILTSREMDSQNARMPASPNSDFSPQVIQNSSPQATVKMGSNPQVLNIGSNSPVPNMGSNPPVTSIINNCGTDPQVSQVTFPLDSNPKVNETFKPHASQHWSSNPQVTSNSGSISQVTHDTGFNAQVTQKTGSHPEVTHYLDSNSELTENLGSNPLVSQNKDTPSLTSPDSIIPVQSFPGYGYTIPPMQSSSFMFPSPSATQSSSSLTNSDTSFLCEPCNGRDSYDFAQPVRPKATYPYSDDSSFHLSGAFSALYGSPSATANKGHSCEISTRYGSPSITHTANKGHGHSCCERVDALERQVEVLKETLDKLLNKKKSKESYGAMSQDGPSQSGQQASAINCSSQQTKSDYTRETLVKDIKDMSPNDAINHIMISLFTTEELINCSVMGVKNDRSTSEHGLDPVRRTLLESIIKEKHGMTTTSIRAVMRNRKKIIKMRNFINNDE